MKTDAEILHAVADELKWDTRLNRDELGVSVDAGVVTLTGETDSWAKRAAAQEAAHRVAGVLDVANEIHVRLTKDPARTDTAIAHAVRHALEWNVFVPDERITSNVSDGQVTLDGEVDYWLQREEAENAVRNLAGVRLVVNRVQLKPKSALAHEVRSAIEHALERRAVREARRVSFDVEEGKVVLTGSVHTWAERRSVVGAARATPGVRSVEDRLRVDPYVM